MLSKACEYGIRAVIYIVSQSKKDIRVGIKEISKKAGAPEPFIAKILQQLAKAGVIASAKGPTGGFYIDTSKPKIMLIDIVYAIDGDALFTTCGLGLKNCSDSRPCPIHHNFKPIRDNMLALFQTTSLNSLSKDLEMGKVFLKR